MDFKPTIITPTTTTPLNSTTTTHTTTPRYVRDGPKTLFAEEPCLVKMKTSSASSPGAAKRIPNATSLKKIERRPDAAAAGAEMMDEVDKKLCKQVQSNISRICELYAKSRSVSSLSEDEANLLRNDITELFSDLTRMEKTAIQNYKKKGIKRRRRRSVLLSTDSKNAKTCASCGTTTTSQWRRGNSEMSVLCNPCGLRFKRQEKEKAQLAMAQATGSVRSTQDKGKITFLLNEPDIIPMSFGSDALP